MYFKYIYCLSVAYCVIIYRNKQSKMSDTSWQFMVEQQVLLCAFYLHVSVLFTYNILNNISHYDNMGYMTALWICCFTSLCLAANSLCKWLTMTYSIWFIHHSLNATRSDKAQNVPNSSLVSDVTLISKIAFLLNQSCTASSSLFKGCIGRLPRWGKFQ